VVGDGFEAEDQLAGDEVEDFALAVGEFYVV